MAPPAIPSKRAPANATDSLTPTPKPKKKLKSAYQPPAYPRYVRDPPMSKFKFLQTIVEIRPTGGVSFRKREGGVLGEIEVATDWRTGEALSKSRYDQNEGYPWAETGYIGSGFSKVTIYVRVISI